MTLGILVNTDMFGEAVAGLTRAARDAGHDVVIFAMDAGTRLLDDPGYRALCGLDGVKMSFCEHSSEQLSVSTANVPDAMICGSQFDNASMIHVADKVIVL